jgi:hypothetical protein
VHKRSGTIHSFIPLDLSITALLLPVQGFLLQSADRTVGSSRQSSSSLLGQPFSDI